MKNKTGSTLVEAAMIFPLVILLLAGIIHVSLFMYEDVVKDSRRHRDEALSDQSLAGADMGTIMRGKWVLE